MPARALQLGQDIGSYRLIRLLGEGGMGAVYEVVHQAIGRRAAMKFLTLDASKHPELAARFVNEARAANRISHPGVVQVYEFGQLNDGTPWMLMEFLDGETLSERLRKLRRAGQVFGRDGLLLLHELSSVLRVAHTGGIVHRDLKPGNIMLVPDPATAVGERVKLLDFGIAKLFHDSARGGEGGEARTRTGAMLGTPAYMAPEQCMSAAHCDGQSDVYAVGVIAYQMVTGRLPHDDEHPLTLMAKKMAVPPQPLGPLEEEFPAEFPALLMSMLEMKPADRPRIDQVEDALGRMLGLQGSRRSGFLGRAATRDKASGTDSAAFPVAGAASEGSGNVPITADVKTVSTVDAPSGEGILDRSLPSPPWLPELAITARPPGADAAAQSSGRAQPLPAPLAGSGAEASLASGPVPMGQIAKRSRTAPLVGIVTGLLVLGSGIATFAFLRRPPPAAHQPTIPNPTIKTTPESVSANPGGLPGADPGTGSKPPEAPAPASAGAVCTPTADNPNCAETVAEQADSESGPGKGAGPGSHRARDHKPLVARPTDKAGRHFVIQGATNPEHEAAIRMCAKANLSTIPHLTEKAVIKLERSGTLQLTTAPPAVLKTNMDECVKQLFLKVPKDSLPDVVTIRVTR